MIKPKPSFWGHFTVLLLAIVLLLVGFNVYVFRGAASPTSYSYRFTVDMEGSTLVEVNFTSTDTSGSSWVLVPKFSVWNRAVTRGSIVQSENVSTVDVGLEDLYFYQAFRFSYRSSSGSFMMNIRYNFPYGGLIVESRGMFFSPQIGFESSARAQSAAEIILDSHLTVDSAHAIAIGSQTYPLTVAPDPHHVLLDPLPENLLRMQVEFTANIPTRSTTLTSQNKVFTFTSANRYLTYASNIVNLYDALYSNYTKLFNVTLTPPVGVQFFLPSFEEFLSVGGFTPFTGAAAGTININIFFIRTVNGTIEVIAAHELVHHFLIKAGLSPNQFLWFHEGMSQYVSVAFVETLGYEGAAQERERLEQSVSELIGSLGGEKFGFLQNWSPSATPTNVGNYYTAAYSVVGRLAQDYGRFNFYARFFELIHGVTVDNIDVLTLYLSRAANASVAFTLQEWGFSVIDLYTSPEIREIILETQKAIADVSPAFQPYKLIAEFLYRQALLSFRRGDIEGGTRFLELAKSMANLAPVLTFLTVAALLGIIAYLLYRSSQKAKMRSVVQPVPPPPPEIFPKSST